MRDWQQAGHCRNLHVAVIRRKKKKTFLWPVTILCLVGLRCHPVAVGVIEFHPPSVSADESGVSDNAEKDGGATRPRCFGGFQYDLGDFFSGAKKSYWRFSLLVPDIRW